MCSLVYLNILSFKYKSLRIEQAGLGVKYYALFNELSIFCCKENNCLLYIHKSHFKDQSNGVFIFIMSKLCKNSKNEYFTLNF